MWKKSLKTEEKLEPVDTMEDVFINRIFKTGLSVTIYLISGIKLYGTVFEFNASAVILKKTEKDKDTLCLIFKHAIATIIVSEDK